MKTTHQRKIEIGEGWFSCTGYVELQIDPQRPELHEHAEVMWLEHDNIRETTYLDLETGAEYDEDPVDDKQWAHEWAENMRQHWVRSSKWRPTQHNKLQ